MLPALNRAQHRSLSSGVPVRQSPTGDWTVAG